MLCDSAMEHYRGSFNNRCHVYSAGRLGADLVGKRSGIASARAKPGARHGLCDRWIGWLAGLGFHVYNVVKRLGGLSWLNLFYSAPVGAPAALALAGAIALATGLCFDIWNAAP